MTPERDLDDTSPGGAQLEPALVELADRLAADRAAVLAAIDGLVQEQADWRPESGVWSVGEVLHHLILSNRGFAKQARALVERGRQENSLAKEGQRRTWPRLRSLADVAASGRLKNPEYVTPKARVPIDELRAKFAESHDAVARQVPTLSPLDYGALKARHPFGFEINLYQWIDAAGAHEQRHLRQIREVLAAPGFPSRT